MTSKQVFHFVSTLFHTGTYWPFTQLLSFSLLLSFLANRLITHWRRCGCLSQSSHFAASDTQFQTGYCMCCWWGCKNSAHFRLLPKCVSHTPMHKVVCCKGEFRAEESWMSSVDYCLSLLTENVGTVSSTTNLSFLDIGGNVPLCINVGKLLSLKTRFKYM